MEPENKQCTHCNKVLVVQKTRRRTITTLSGPTDITMVTLHCPDHPDQIVRPKYVLTPPKSTYGYDIIAEAGRLRFLENKQIQEIRSHFYDRGIDIPKRTVHWLCDRFLHYMMAVHYESLPDIAQIIKKRGGYVLHVDSSGRRGPMILLLSDGWSGIRILAAPIKSEAVEHIVPHLRVVRKHLDDPVAVIRDMSKGMESAVAEVFPGVYIIICHYHFLRNVAMTLFEPFYPRFRNRIDRLGVKKRLREVCRILKRRKDKNEEEVLTLEIIEHILAYEKDGNGLAYPFSLPAVNFYRRCQEAAKCVRKAILDRAKMNIHSPFLCSLEDILRRLQPPPPVLGRLKTDFEGLENRWSWFQRVRRALRYRNGPIPLSTDIQLSDADLKKGRAKLDWVLGKIEEFEEKGGINRHNRELRKALRKVATMIKEHREELFAPNVSLDVNGRRVVRKLPRTNQQEEVDFRMARRHARRIRGNSDVEPQFQRDGPGLLIVRNLSHREYVRVLYGSLDQMADRFAKVSPDSLTTIKSLMNGSRELSTGGNH